MSLDIFEQMEIRSYFMLESRIAEIKKCIQRLREFFYDQTMCSHVSSNGLAVISEGFSVERNVVLFVDAVLSKERIIEILKNKKRFFEDYLNSLNEQDRLYLLDKYTNNKFSDPITEIEVDLYQEIQEIEVAINYMFGFPQDFQDEIKGETLHGKINSIAQLLGV